MGTSGFAVIRLPGGSGTIVLLHLWAGGTRRNRAGQVSPALRRDIRTSDSEFEGRNRAEPVLLCVNAHTNADICLPPGSAMIAPFELAFELANARPITRSDQSAVTDKLSLMSIYTLAQRAPGVQY